jgi:hypothetical protein
MQEYEIDGTEPCHDCDYYRELIDRTNQELMHLRKPLGLCSLPDSVASIDTADTLANPEAYEQRLEEEEQLQRRLKSFTLSLTQHQQVAHRASV